ncbi:MAG TPA: amidohydrolase family protein [Candidatus Limnocylindrales bacterium]|nr:amidohydrolase family protein [Candidatus Limnocylindrales bacterium]
MALTGAPAADRGRTGAPDLALEGRLVEDGCAVRLVVRDGRVAAIERLQGEAATDAWIAPGWMDIQVNGFEGHDVNAADVTPDEVAAMVRALWRYGVTAVCPTVCTQSEDRIVRSLRSIADACAADPLVGTSIVGIHVEGPHIAREDGPRGAHPLEHVRPPDVAEYRRWQEAAAGRIRIITVSPEYEGAVEYVRTIVADGVVASIGHTAASGDQIRAVVDAGARWSTHLGNGAHAVLPRHPNYVWDQLAEDRLSAGFIFDGHHLPPAVMRTVVRAKGVERTVLVTDAVAAAGLPPGVYEAAVGGTVELLPSGRLTLAGTPYLAGSAATLPGCLGNAVRHAAVTRSDAIRMVTANPSRLLGLPAARGHESVRAGIEANLTVFRDPANAGADPEVLATIVAGSLVFGSVPATS